MTANRAALVGAFSLLALAGCRTTRIPEPYVIPLPPQITSQQLEVAVLAGILNTHPPPEYDPTAELPEDEFDLLIWQTFVSSARGRSWFPEPREGNTIYAAVNTRGRYLRVAIERDADTLQIRLVESRGLRQSGRQIHKRAIKWLRNLEANIRREVGRMALVPGRAAWLHIRSATSARQPEAAWR